MIQKEITVSNNQKEDARTIRSKRDLANALEELMQEINYDDIGIKDITDRALVSKNTFYNNFNDKNELLRFLFCRYEDTLMKEIKPLLDKTIHATRYIFFNKCIDIVVHFFFTSNLPFKTMIQNDKSHSIYSQLTLFIRDVIKKLDDQYNYILSNKLDQNLASIFYSGAFAATIYFCFTSEVEPDEKAIAKSIKKMTFPVVE